jgi:hypothetical protein
MRLTDKGERWLLNVIGYGRVAIGLAAIFAAYGFVGWIQTH